MTQTKREMELEVLPFGEILWNPAFNVARPTGNLGSTQQLEGLRTSLATDAWRNDTNGMVLVDTINNTWQVGGKPVVLKELAKQAQEERAQQWSYHKVTVKATPSEENKNALKAFEALYVLDGKIRPIKYMGVTGNRRASQFLGAMTDRLSMTDDGKYDGEKFIEGSKKPLTINDAIPCIIRDCSNEELRNQEQLRENLDKNQYYLAPSPIDQLMSAKRIVEAGGNQMKLRRTFNDGLGQKYYYVLLLNAMFKALRIYERCIKPPVDPETKEVNEDHIPLASVKFDKVLELGQCATDDGLASVNANRAKKGNPLAEKATEKVVAEYFNNVAKGETGGAKKILEKSSIETLSKTHSNAVVRGVAQRIMLGTSSKGEELTGWMSTTAPAVDGIKTLHDDGDYPEIEDIIMAFAKVEKGKKRDKLFQAAKAALGIRPQAQTNKGQSNKKPAAATA